MERKVFEAKGRFRSAKEKLFRSISLGKEDSSAPSPTPRARTTIVAPHEPTVSFINYNSKAELKKAQALMYHRIFDRPR